MWPSEKRLRSLHGRGFWYIYLWEGWLRFGLPISVLHLSARAMLDAYRGTATRGELVEHAEAHLVTSFFGALLWAVYVLYRVDHPSDGVPERRS